MDAVETEKVRALRKRTGQSVLVCRDAIARAGGDVERARQIILASGSASTTEDRQAINRLVKAAKAKSEVPPRKSENKK